MAYYFISHNLFLNKVKEKYFMWKYCNAYFVVSWVRYGLHVCMYVCCSTTGLHVCACMTDVLMYQK